MPSSPPGCSEGEGLWKRVTSLLSPPSFISFCLILRFLPPSLFLTLLMSTGTSLSLFWEPLEEP